MSHCSRQASFLAALVIAALASPCGVTPLAAQPAADEQLDMRELSRKGSTIRRWVADPGSDPSLRPVYEQYFGRYFFPTMTKSDPATLGELGDMRVELFRNFIEPAAPEIQQELTQQAYRFAGTVIGGRYARPVKVNAVLILGQLNERYAGGGQPAKPLPAATRLLCQIVKASVDRQRAPAYLHVAAMAGLERHAALFGQLDNQSKSFLGATLLAAINQQEFPSGVDDEVKDWMRMQAARAIAEIGVPARGGVFVDALQKMISDPNVGLATRVDVAAMLSRFNLSGDTVPGPVATRTIGALKNLACAVAQSELESANEFEDLQVQTRRVATAFYESKRIRLDPEGGWEYQRRGLITQLAQLRTALLAAANIAEGETETLRGLAGAVENAVETAEGTSNTDFDVVDSIKLMVGEVDRLAGCNAPPPGAQEDASNELLGGAPTDSGGAPTESEGEGGEAAGN